MHQQTNIPADVCLCTNCGHLNYPKKRIKGTALVEMALFSFSIAAAVFNLAFGALLFFVFVIYGVWRLTTKHKACKMCESANIIPANSPMAQRMLANQ